MCDQVEPIFKAIEFIESHLQEDLAVAQIADAAGYSLFHFMRKFNQTVHHTPYDYLMRRRLSEAAKALVQSDLRILDIACDYGFHDQETFSRVFRRMFQMTPSQCRKQNGITTRCLMAAKTIEDLQFINGEHFHMPHIDEKKETVLFGLMTRADSGKPNVDIQCEELIQDLTAAGGLKADAMIYCHTLRMDANRQNSYRFVGAEETAFDVLPSLLVRSILPSGRYLCMDAPQAQASLALAYLYSSWLPGANLEGKGDQEITRLSIGTLEEERQITILIPIKEAGQKKQTTMEGSDD